MGMFGSKTTLIMPTFNTNTICITTAINARLKYYKKIIDLVINTIIHCSRAPVISKTRFCYTSLDLEAE